MLRSIADALHLNTEQLLAQAGWASSDDGGVGEDTVSGNGPGAVNGTEESIRRDPRLSEAQREALLGVYRSFAAGAAGADPR